MSFKFQVLGTVVSSVLNYDQFTHAMGELPAINNATSSYVPCDGRSIVDSALEKLTKVGRTQPDPQNHITNAPDLRGKFVRGLNLMYSPGNPDGFDSSLYGDTESGRTKVASYQADETKRHTHAAHSSGGVPINTSGMGIQSDEGPQIQFGAPSITVDEYNGAESRPRNIAVYFYIKIN